MRGLGVICDMERRRRRLTGLYSLFFAKKRVSRVNVVRVLNGLETFDPRLPRSLRTPLTSMANLKVPDPVRCAGGGLSPEVLPTRDSYRSIPNRASDHAVTRYSMTVRAQPAPMLGQKPIPARSSAGSTRNIGSDGRTYQNVDSAWLAIRAVSAVSRQSQMIPSSDTNGSDTIKAAKAGLRLATSDTTATMMPDSAHLRMKYSIGSTAIWSSCHAC